MDKLFDFQLLKIGMFKLTMGNIFMAIGIILFTKLILVLINKIFLNRYLKRHDVDFGRSYAIRSILSYIAYTISTVWLLKNFGFDLSVLLLGSAGLLVGLGFGLQSTFFDFVAGIVILVEGSVNVGDVLVVDGVVGSVKKIRLRTTEINTRDQVGLIIPNSKLISNSVTNWNHNDSAARFHIDIGVAYHSNLEFVEKIILQAIATNPNVLANPKPSVQLVDFGASALQLKVYFFSDEFFYIEAVKSDLRKSIVIALRHHNIEIPYPHYVVQMNPNQN